MRMRLFKLSVFKSKLFLGLVMGVILASGLIYLGNAGMKATSTNEYCESCHVHPFATDTWKQGAHYKNESGVVVGCVDCHLPPEGIDYIVEKGKAGARDIYGYYFKDLSKIDWDFKSTIEEAAHYTFEESCTHCHQELFPPNLNNKGVDAHIHYRKNRDELRCINCHLKTGHFHEGAEEQYLPTEEVTEEEVGPTEPLISEIEPGAFVSYTEEIPNTNVKFEMVAIPAGTFNMGTPDSEPGHQPDEGPQRSVELGGFWMGKFEVSWREFDAYYSETVTRGKNEQGLKSDAITGPTPPYGSPDQGWGKGSRPAITMTHYAATKYCEWLSARTGRTYRLPTEAEWEYAARAGTTAAYFFESDEPAPSWYDRFLSRIMGGAVVNEEVLGEYAVYRANSKNKTQPAQSKKPNPWGLYNVYGNVREFCQTWYDPEFLAKLPEGQVVKDPRGPESAAEHVVRGGSFKSEPLDLRSGARDMTRHRAWMKTDPQTPKSVWWFSDCTDVGFRIVREGPPE